MGDGTAPGSSGTWILGRVAMSAPNSRAGAVDEPCERQAPSGTATVSAAESWCGVHDGTAFPRGWTAASRSLTSLAGSH